MPLKFGTRSRKALETMHPDLVAIHNHVLYVYNYDHSVLEGNRSKKRQLELFYEGKSKIDGITRMSKHNFYPSLATDAAPYPIDFDNDLKIIARFYYFAGLFMAAAKELKKQGVITHDIRCRS